MMRGLCLVVAMLAAAAQLPGQSSDQPPTRRGFAVGLGLGPGSATGNCDRCTNNEWTTGLTGYLRLGAMISPRILVGVEGTGWQGHRDSNRSDESMVFGSFTVLWYPSRAGAVFLKLGAGGMRYTTTNGSEEIKTRTRPAASVGLGYEFRVGRHVSVVPFGNLLYASSGVVTLNGQPYPGFPLEIQGSLVQLGAGVTFR